MYNIEIKNNLGEVLIDGTHQNLCVLQAGTVSWVLKDNAWFCTIEHTPTITPPMVAINWNGLPNVFMSSMGFVTKNAQNLYYKYEVKFGSITSYPAYKYALILPTEEVIVPKTSGYCLEIYNNNSNLIFSGDARFMRIRDVVTVSTPDTMQKFNHVYVKEPYYFVENLSGLIIHPYNYQMSAFKQICIKNTSPTTGEVGFSMVSVIPIRAYVSVYAPQLKIIVAELSY